MNWKHYLLLAVCGLAVTLFVASFQSTPGYMDADYYFMGGQRLAQGHGFSEMILWNYLDDPTGLPHPSHSYWMPLASLLAAGGMSLARDFSLTFARMGFILAAILAPPLTAALAFSITNRRDLSLAAGFLAVFAGYYISFLSITDTFSLYMLFGGIFFYIVGLAEKSNSLKSKIALAFTLGLVSGLMHLTRADGALWLVVALFIVFLWTPLPGRNRWFSFVFALTAFAGYLLVMAPWFARNLSVFGTLLAPGGSRALWLTNYNQLFAYPADQLSMQNWLASGWQSILSARWDALIWNLGTTLGVQGAIFLLPFIIAGMWHYRSDKRVQTALIAWLLTFAAMTIAFPFAGSRGGYLHSGAAFQPMWWALAPVGVDMAIGWAGRARGWNVRQARQVFLSGMVFIAFILSGAIFLGRVVGEPAWGTESRRYARVEQFLQANGSYPDSPVIVANPPGYFIVSGRPAIAVPDGNLSTVFELSNRYGAKYLILEKDGTPDGLAPVYESGPTSSSIRYMGEIAGSRIFEIP